MDSTDTLAKEGCVKFVERFSGIKFTGDINNSEAVSEYLDNNREDAHLAYLCGEEALARKRMIEAGRRKQQEEK